jgi:hypothetical protein
VEDRDFLVLVRATVLSAGVFSASGVRSSAEVFLFSLSGFFWLKLLVFLEEFRVFSVWSCFRFLFVCGLLQELLVLPLSYRIEKLEVF